MTNSAHHLPSVFYDQTCSWTITNIQDITKGNVLLLFSLKSSKKHFCDTNKRAQIHAGLSLLQWKLVEDRTHARSSEHTQPPLSANPSQHRSFCSRSSFILPSDWPSTGLSDSQDRIQERAATFHERDVKMADACSKWPLGTIPLITLYVFSLPLLHVVLAVRGMSCSLKSRQKTQTTKHQTKSLHAAGGENSDFFFPRKICLLY